MPVVGMAVSHVTLLILEVCFFAWNCKLLTTIHHISTSFRSVKIVLWDFSQSRWTMWRFTVFNGVVLPNGCLLSVDCK